jgi:hypothetical protein
MLAVIHALRGDVPECPHKGAVRHHGYDHSRPGPIRKFIEAESTHLLGGEGDRMNCNDQGEVLCVLVQRGKATYGMQFITLVLRCSFSGAVLCVLMLDATSWRPHQHTPNMHLTAH